MRFFGSFLWIQSIANLILSLYIPTTLACGDHDEKELERRQFNLGFPSVLFQPSTGMNFRIGNDNRQPNATLGYLHHHYAIFCNDFEAMMTWYREVLGFRTAFRAEWDVYKIAHLAYPSGGGRNTNHQTGEELYATETQRAGTLELLWYKGITKVPFSPVFSHLGLVVPDVVALEKRLETYGGVTFLKKANTEQFATGTSQYFGFPIGVPFPEWFKVIIPKQYSLFLDPEGNMIEAMPAL